jgi:tRNA(fMet)-specific endonuclease VapC
MPYVLDTDMLTLYEEGHPKVTGCVSAHPLQDVATTVISVEEQLSGWFTMLRRAKDRKTSA